MAELDKIVDANKQYSRNFKHGNLSIPLARKLAVLACMDARLNVNEALGLKTGDAHIIRNAGGIATDDAIRSLIISHELLGTQEFVVINHTDCGMLTFTDKDLQKDLRQKYKSDASEIKFYSFLNLEENVKNQVNKIKSSPFFSQDIPVHGFIYDLKTGKIERITGDQKTINEISVSSSSP
ncbi:MAG: beta-class carbonic anhydrase [Nitrososphaeraceae archaeon]